MAKMNFGGVEENVVTSKEFTVEKAREVLKDETIAIIGYGIQGPGQAGNLRDNRFNVIVGQRPSPQLRKKAKEDGWVPERHFSPLRRLHRRELSFVCSWLMRSDSSVAYDKETSGSPPERRSITLMVSPSTGRIALV